MHRKPHLPIKNCLACARPFAWRKKWARDWNEVRYCSDRCRREKGRGGPSPSAPHSEYAPPTSRRGRPAS